jgi:hypothetical protein
LIIIEDLIKEAASKLNNFNYKLFVEQPDDDIQGLNIIKGQLQVKEIVADSLKLNKPMFYLSGPPGNDHGF